MEVVSGILKMLQVEIDFRKVEIYVKKNTQVSDGTESLCVSLCVTCTETLTAM